MKILALDSTALTSTAAIAEDGKPLAVCSVTYKLNHSATLLPMIDSLFLSTGLTAGDIDIFAYSSGPGSFTGVRIGAATIKGLAFGKDKPCVPVSSLEALAYNLTGFDGIICPVMDARRGQVYNALFENGDRVCEDRVITLAELSEELKKYSCKKIYFVGDGYGIAKEAVKHPCICDTPPALRNQNAFSVAICGEKCYNETIGKDPDHDFSDSAALPSYLRASQAERERNERLRKGEE
ncbi:MAG: tRNA (adenosine(37)-N6)-threonylcarbamoyltransferase complex dimerization subunit type 1 TsaB [Clostridia bacterium]|nr:tRNA (adenosine(37)-N6)-threonylcarbamoyltransferase complex dimerization subunit type 1 TsaB [Clostridia bacterium]